MKIIQLIKQTHLKILFSDSAIHSQIYLAIERILRKNKHNATVYLT